MDYSTVLAASQPRHHVRQQATSKAKTRGWLSKEAAKRVTRANES